MTFEQATRDPVLLKAGGAVVLFLLGGNSSAARYAAAGLAAWAAWDYYQRRQRPPLQVQPLPLQPPQQTAPGSALPGQGFRPFSVIPGGATASPNYDVPPYVWRQGSPVPNPAYTGPYVPPPSSVAEMLAATTPPHRGLAGDPTGDLP